MLGDIEKLDQISRKLKLKTMEEGDEVIQAIDVIQKFSNRNHLDDLTRILAKLQLKIGYQEVVYSGE